MAENHTLPSFDDMPSFDDIPDSQQAPAQASQPERPLMFDDLPSFDDMPASAARPQAESFVPRTARRVAHEIPGAAGGWARMGAGAVAAPFFARPLLRSPLLVLSVERFSEGISAIKLVRPASMRLAFTTKIYWPPTLRLIQLNNLSKALRLTCSALVLLVELASPLVALLVEQWRR
ncbi:hypothetical protein [Bradyrhizobium acaciae]|uniref:hypothetical protein n=1 Tax=Bradyrhizobium acaciae TaxID=2683706 RepID=UPI001E33ADD2|nr:hypothetical protein [Bradyrhizobium acaciae]MCC8977310.1 hypothetical protein [Bradyrhizobium acaciae]